MDRSNTEPQTTDEWIELLDYNLKIVEDQMSSLSEDDQLYIDLDARHDQLTALRLRLGFQQTSEMNEALRTKKDD
jgi:hypothetical protein